MLPGKKPLHVKRVLEPQKGFTLIEIIMTMAIVGILISVAIPNFSRWKEKHEINGQAQKVYFDLILARTNAVKNNSLVRVAYNTIAHTYTIHQDLNNDGIQDAGEPVKNGTLENNINFAINNGWLDIDRNGVNVPVSFGGGQTVVFDPRGQASNSGSVFLLHPSDIGVTSDRARCITVLAATGGVDYWTYDGSVAAGQAPWK